MRIAYCEDEEAQAEYVSDMIEKWCMKCGIIYEIEWYKSAEQFLFETEEAELFAYDIILLDISMDGMDGFALAEKIRQTDKKVKLVFVTSDADYVFKGYEVEAFRYIMKPVTQEKINDMLDCAAAQLEHEEQEYVILEVAGEMRKIDKQDILYVEVDGHYTTIYCEKDEFTVKKSIKDVLLRLNACPDFYDKLFVKCHRSAAVNITKITRIGRECLRLKNGKELPISRGMYEELNRSFIQHNLNTQL